MPELPEVETVMRGLTSALLGHVIERVTVVRRDLRRPIPPTLAAQLEGQRIDGFRRRGKYILMRFSSEMSLLIHLGMSGRIRIGSSPIMLEPHEHVVFQTADGLRVGFIDPRRFGLLDLVPTLQEKRHVLLRDLGPEPLEPDFNAQVLGARLVGRRTTIKAALLDQRVVAGLGNIYVSEALFRARLSPRRIAASVAGPRAERLVDGIRTTLKDAIAAGGSSLRDYVQPNGALGYFQNAWKVYGREGEPCERCQPGCRGIRCIAQNGRSSFYCSRTQR